MLIQESMKSRQSSTDGSRGTVCEVDAHVERAKVIVWVAMPVLPFIASSRS